MKYIFFNESGELDPRALGGGVYAVELLLKSDLEKKICLYVGEAGCVVDRCATHLRKFSNNPEYFGLTKKDVSCENLILRFSLVEEINQMKTSRWDKLYKNKEKKIKRKLKPITQISSEKSDRIKNQSKKKDDVQEAMKVNGFI